MRTSCARPGQRLAGAAAIIVLSAAAADAQMVRIQAQREVQPPDYATFRLGPLYSAVSWTETVGYRYTTSSGSGSDYLISNDRGTIKEDGSDFPILSSLTFRNYLVLSRYADVDASFTASYWHYPMDTQDDEFFFDLAQEGVYGTLSTEFRLSPYLYGALYDSIIYRTDYVDTRGLQDRYGGQRYRYLQNTVGGRLNWLMAPRDTLTLSLSRGDWWSMDNDFDDQERTEYTEGLTYTRMAREGVNVGAESTFHQYLYKSDSRDDTLIQDYRLFARIDQGAGPAWMENSAAAAHVGYSLGTGTSSGATNENDMSTVNAGASLDTELRKDLSHGLSYEHGLTGGFNSSFEEYDNVSYRLNWAGQLGSAVFRSAYSSVQPSADDSGDYTTWANGVTLSRALSKLLSVTLDSTYTLRNNRDADTTDTAQLEDTSDYETWVTTLSTGFQLTKRTTFTTSLQHAERFSDAEDLAYTRDTFEAHLTYRRQF